MPEEEYPLMALDYNLFSIFFDSRGHESKGAE